MRKIYIKQNAICGSKFGGKLLDWKIADAKTMLNEVRKFTDEPQDKKISRFE